ncbi:ATP-binding protein [Alkalitalea saponilacus]|uniref:ATP-dependent DNA helicase RecG n=1 Tax=Alkalitalea saponilacus TaxID=889453 RepID=A0A1T5HUF5_9BACT|nr:ATP-binding protein [Alkalitalea saponilacus]ASB50378.1 transcriptional regulator [Alkalitalea saponilacus]ASB50456.1 transcriptional regulator [Alkalitalea saponilacus]SKC24298.1 ATP-dependent DNA helicase RecG [Alkalitalea saponilacus]
MSENQNIEWKESWRDEYLKWICGFANAQGGKLIIGKSDNGRTIGIENSKKLLEDIPNKIQSQLGIICDVNLIEENTNEIIEIVVKPYDNAISYQGKYHYRSGSTKQELKGKALNDFLLKKSGKTWDDVIENRATLDDIDPNAIEAFIKAAVISKRMPFIESETNTEIVLDNLLLRENGLIKRSAIVLFGKNPCKFYINAFVKIGRFGKTDDDLIFQEVVEGNAFQIADKTLEILDKKFLISPISYDGLHRIEKWEYPYKAVRETIINAIVHRDYFGAPVQISVYDDKIMIWNEGKLPEGFSIEDLKKKHTSRPYNPTIASVFFKGGLIEAWGRGTINIISECIKAGLPEPSFESEFGGISVKLFKPYTEKYLTEKGLNKRQIKAVFYCKENDFITNSIYQTISETSERTATRDLEFLTEIGLFEKVGEKKGTKYKLIRV